MNFILLCMCNKRVTNIRIISHGRSNGFLGALERFGNITTIFDENVCLENLYAWHCVYQHCVLKFLKTV